jgi:predicted transcriptional regulator
MNSKELINQIPFSISEVLPYSKVSEIAREHNLTRTTVSKILKGQHNNPEVLESALRILEDTKQKIDTIMLSAAEWRVDSSLVSSEAGSG